MKELLLEGKKIASESESLIPGLPNDVSKRCLAYLRRILLYKFRTVSKKWKEYLGSSEIIKFREEYKIGEEWLYVFRSDPSITRARCFDPRTKIWSNLPLMPSDPYTYGLSNFRCVSVAELLFVIGGVSFDPMSYPADIPVASKRMYIFNTQKAKWFRGADMHHARGNFACAVYKKSIIVAGGGSRHAFYSAGGSRLRSSEVYSVEKNIWTLLPSTSLPRSGSVGFAVENGCGQEKFVVMGGYSDSYTLHGIVSVDENRSDMDILDINSHCWSRLGNSQFNHGRFKLGKVAQLRNEVYRLHNNKIWRMQFSSSSWEPESSFSGFSSDQLVLFPLNNELYFVSAERNNTEASFTPIHAYNPMKKTWRQIRAEGFRRNLCGSHHFHLSTDCIVVQRL